MNVFVRCRAVEPVGGGGAGRQARVALRAQAQLAAARAVRRRPRRALRQLQPALLRRRTCAPPLSNPLYIHGPAELTLLCLMETMTRIQAFCSYFDHYSLQM